MKQAPSIANSIIVTAKKLQEDAQLFKTVATIYLQQIN